MRLPERSWRHGRRNAILSQAKGIGDRGPHLNSGDPVGSAAEKTLAASQGDVALAAAISAPQ